MNWNHELPKYLIKKIKRSDALSGLEADFVIQRHQFNTCVKNKDYKGARHFLSNMNTTLHELEQITKTSTHRPDAP